MFASTEVGEVTLNLKEKECDFEWKIEKSRLFPPAPRSFHGHDCPSKAGFPPSYFRPPSEYHLSRRFSFEGETWNVGICPKKWDIHLYVYRRLSAIPPIDVEISVAFKTVSGKEILRKEETYYFRGDSYHGMEGSMSRNILAKESEFVTSGFLTVVCTLKRLEDTGSTVVGNTSTFSVSTPNAGHFIGAASQPTGSGLLEQQTSAFRTAASTSTGSKPLGVRAFHKKAKRRIPTSGVSATPNAGYPFEAFKQSAFGQQPSIFGTPASTECSYCRENVANISSHAKKCMDRPIKCPECSEVVLLQDWNDHKCQNVGLEDDSSLCDDLKEVLLNGLSHDLILKVGDRELRAHQDILRTRSQVFKSMLSHDMKEKASYVIDIPDCDPGAMEQFLCYIYTGKVDSLDPSNMLKLYYIADKYDMKGLKQNCCAFIKESLSVTNICEVIQLALNHNDSSLLEHATEYFMDNAIDIMHTVEWQSFMKDNSTTANELMIKSFEELKNKNT